VRVVVAATAEVAIPTLEWLKESEHDLIRVITTPDSRVPYKELYSMVKALRVFLFSELMKI